MRKEFADWVKSTFAPKTQNIFLTGDLGYNALEPVVREMGERFINAGVAEQNMISVAAGLASEGLLPLCYSIAPFIVFRPAEQIRLDVCIHKLNVKIVGNGGGYGYGIMGASHHALEDVGVLSTFPNMECIIPVCNQDVEGACNAMMDHKGPSYLRLGFGMKPEDQILPPFQCLRQLTSGNELTVVGMGPVALNAWNCIMKAKISAEMFVISQIPLPQLTDDLIKSVQKTKRVLIVEEHVSRGGIGEYLARLFLINGLSPEFHHLSAIGYPDQRYGSQAFHVKASGMDEEGIKNYIFKIISTKAGVS